jgi:hypothetical protein
MNRIAAHVFAALVLASLAAVLMSASVFAKENPGHHFGPCCNAGHHYGQLKHPKTPTPTPNPNPNPNPNPTPRPVTHPGSGGGSTVTISATKPDLTDGGTTTLIPVTLTLPVEHQAGGPIQRAALPTNALDWLILLILPLLLAVWVIAGAGLTRKAARKIRVSPAAVPAPNPA